MSDFLVFQVAIFDNDINGLGVSRVPDDQVGVSTPQKKERLIPRKRYTTQ